MTTPGEDAAEPPASPRWLVAVVAMVVVAAVAALAPLFAGAEPPGLDLPIHLGEIRSLVSSLSAGDLGGWSPSANLGFASGAYYQVVPQLLVAVAHVLFGRWVSLGFLFKLAIVLPLALLPATVARALIVAGGRPGGAALAALASACVFAAPPWGLGPDAVFRLGLFTQPFGLVFAPLAVAHGARVLGARSRSFGRAFGYALACGLCHPFVGACLVPALGVVLVCRRGAGTGRGLLLFGLVLAASAFFWLPILVESTSFGGFPARRADEAGLPPSALLDLLVRGRLLDEGRLPVLTAAGLGAVVAAAFLRRRDRLLGVLVLMALVFGGLLTALPAIGPIAGDLVPGIRFLAPFQLALAMAAGLVVAASAGVCARRLGRVVAAALVLAFGAVLAVGAAGRCRDLGRTLDEDPSAHRAELAELLPVLSGLPPGRIATARSLGSSIPAWSYLPAVFAGKPAFRAFGGAALQSSTNYVFLRQAEPRATAHVFGIRYAFARRANVLPGDRVLARSAHFALLELGDGRLFAAIRVAGSVPEARAAREKATWDWLATAGPGRDEHLAIGAESSLSPAGQGRVLAETEAPSRYGADVEADRPTTFVLRVTFHPWWRVTVDGHPAPLRRVTPDFLAVDAPAGRHALAFHFTRPVWVWLLLGAGIAIAIAIAIGLGLAGRRRPG
jgi:hypothetical protein